MTRSVIFCSSQSNAESLQQFIDRLRTITPPHIYLNVFDPNFDEDLTGHLNQLPESERLQNPVYKATVVAKVHNHNRKIRKADVCFIFNPGGYIGNNTHAELVAAAEHDKLVFALEKPILMGLKPDRLHEEPSATAYIDDFICTPEDLLKRLL